MVRFIPILPFLLLVLMISIQMVESEPTKIRPPNVVLILVDDLGWADLGCYGSTFHETPNLDALAKRGALFTDAYAASPVCSPTRASILSGKYPSRIGMSYLAGVSGPSGPSYKLIPPKVTGNIPAEDTTLAEALREHGYATSHIGKWHLQGHGEKGNAQFPEKHGFDINIAGQAAGQPGSYYFPYKSKEQPNTDLPDMEDGKEGDYLTDALTTKAIQFIADSADRPFFLNLWYYTVHTPIEPREDKLKKYNAKAKILDQTAFLPISEHQSQTRSAQNHPAYAAMVESLDENVGRLVDALRSRGLEDNTIIVFTSDNGGLSTGQKGTMPACNLPLRAGKAWLYEGGIREPLLVSYPPAIKPGLRLAEPVVSTDIFPTVLGLADLPLLPKQHLDGMNLAPLLEGTSSKLERQAIFFHLPHYHHINTMGPSGAVRAGDYKLIEVFETGKKELYNLKQDIGETQDLSQEKTELVEQLSQMIEEWRKSSGSQMATLNPDYTSDKDWRKAP